MKKYQSFLPENFQFLEVKFSIYLHRRVFVMCWAHMCECMFSDVEVQLLKSSV